MEEYLIIFFFSRSVKLKYLEHKCCIVAFLVLTESKLKNWTIKYGSEEKVKQIMTQYRTFVSKNKIFQEKTIIS